MDSKLAQDLKFPLVKLPNPIKLRLADGDSSSVITHRTVPLQLHIGNHVETVSFYVTSLCHDLEDDPIQTYPQKESTTELSVLEEPEPMENVGFKKPISHIINKETQDMISGNSIHADIYPFVEATSKSEEDVPTEILSEFAGVFEKDQADVLPATSKF
ncbi:hypothetical protein BASA62_008284 [Batrachochytrium salamandrivorans]|nr:hypothetical protein BASA62_008284 [Batrachochytrium salamandrivorans]